MRKFKQLAITSDNRDRGKVFLISEMPASQAERWGMRMMEALAKSGASIPDALEKGGLAGVAVLGFSAILGAPSSLTMPLMDEMFNACVSIIPDPAKPTVVRGAQPPVATNSTTVGPLIDDDTEELSTRLLLRSEVFELHTGFSIADFLSQKWQEGAAMMSNLTSPNTATSEASAGALSPQD